MSATASTPATRPGGQSISRTASSNQSSPVPLPSLPVTYPRGSPAALSPMRLTSQDVLSHGPSPLRQSALVIDSQLVPIEDDASIRRSITYPILPPVILAPYAGPLPLDVPAPRPHESLYSFTYRHITEANTSLLVSSSPVRAIERVTRAAKSSMEMDADTDGAFFCPQSSNAGTTCPSSRTASSEPSPSWNPIGSDRMPPKTPISRRGPHVLHDPVRRQDGAHRLTMLRMMFLRRHVPDLARQIDHQRTLVDQDVASRNERPSAEVSSPIPAPLLRLHDVSNIISPIRFPSTSPTVFLPDPLEVVKSISQKLDRLIRGRIDRKRGREELDEVDDLAKEGDARARNGPARVSKPNTPHSFSPSLQQNARLADVDTRLANGNYASPSTPTATPLTPTPLPGQYRRTRITSSATPSSHIAPSQPSSLDIRSSETTKRSIPASNKAPSRPLPTPPTTPPSTPSLKTSFVSPTSNSAVSPPRSKPTSSVITYEAHPLLTDYLSDAEIHARAFMSAMRKKQVKRDLRRELLKRGLQREVLEERLGLRDFAIRAEECGIKEWKQITHAMHNARMEVAIQKRKSAVVPFIPSLSNDKGYHPLSGLRNDRLPSSWLSWENGYREGSGRVLPLLDRRHTVMVKRRKAERHREKREEREVKNLILPVAQSTNEDGELESPTIESEAKSALTSTLTTGEQSPSTDKSFSESIVASTSKRKLKRSTDAEDIGYFAGDEATAPLAKRRHTYPSDELPRIHKPVAVRLPIPDFSDPSDPSAGVPFPSSDVLPQSSTSSSPRNQGPIAFPSSDSEPVPFPSSTSTSAPVPFPSSDDPFALPSSLSFPSTDATSSETFPTPIDTNNSSDSLTSLDIQSISAPTLKPLYQFPSASDVSISISTPSELQPSTINFPSSPSSPPVSPRYEPLHSLPPLEPLPTPTSILIARSNPPSSFELSVGGTVPPIV